MSAPQLHGGSAFAVLSTRQRRAACRQMIWAELRERGVRQDDPVTWPPLVHIDSLGGGLLDAAATSPALVAAYDQLIGPGRWTPQVYAGGAIVVRFPSQDRANAAGRVGSLAGSPGHRGGTRDGEAELTARWGYRGSGPGRPDALTGMHVTERNS